MRIYLFLHLQRRGCYRHRKKWDRPAHPRLALYSRDGRPTRCLVFTVATSPADRASAPLPRPTERRPSPRTRPPSVPPPDEALPHRRSRSFRAAAGRGPSPPRPRLFRAASDEALPRRPRPEVLPHRRGPRPFPAAPGRGPQRASSGRLRCGECWVAQVRPGRPWTARSRRAWWTSDDGGERRRPSCDPVKSPGPLLYPAASALCPWRGSPSSTSPVRREPHGARVQRSKSPRMSMRTQLPSYTCCLKITDQGDDHYMHLMIQWQNLMQR